MESKPGAASHILQSGAEYLDGMVAELVAQESAMQSMADSTELPQVQEGYRKFVEVLHHCAETLRVKSAELRKHPLS